MTSEYMLGVDVGGTFTDVCVLTPSGETIRAKTPSTPHDQSIGVKNGINKVRRLLEDKYGWNGEFSFVHHGTTVATNAILEGKGGKSALIVTAGHKDVLSVRRSQIAGGLGAWINFMPPPPIIPLERTVQCTERIDVRGSVIKSVDEATLRLELKDLKRLHPDLDAVTIALLNSYSNDKHERQVASIVREVYGSTIEIICSAHVLPEAGEYERTVTAAVNACVRPVVKKYLDNLQLLLKPDTSAIRILKSDGGLTSIPLAEELPVNLLMSGPAGGVRGVLDVVAKQTAYKNLITLDMGGTSTDCALIVDGVPSLRRETIFDQVTVRASSVDVRTVGAGGGSMAKFIGLTNTLRVGPESAGATPGPACYGKGGTAPTVADANLFLGYLPSSLLGGDFVLDVEAAATALSDLALQMGLNSDKKDNKNTATSVAESIIKLVNETMYSAVRLVSVEQGHDPRDFALVAFGGAGPLHANAVGKLLGAWPVIVPPSPGVLCAQGDVTTQLRHEQSASYIRVLGRLDEGELLATVARLEDTCRAKISEAMGMAPQAASGVVRVHYECDVRYKGQALTLTIPIADTALQAAKDGNLATLAAMLRNDFNTAHDKAFNYALLSYDLEIVRLGVICTDISAETLTASARAAKNAERSTHLDDLPVVVPSESAIIARRPIIIDGQTVEAVFWDRSLLGIPGTRVQGPGIITEMDSNTLVLPGYEATVDYVGNILIWPLGKDAKESSSESSENLDEVSAAALVGTTSLIPTLLASALASIRNEMDTLMLRCAMSPAIREQQDEFNVITNNTGQMLVGQFGSFIASFLAMWADRGTIDEGDIFVTNDVYEVGGAVTHLNDVIVLLPIFYEHRLVGWAANFGHLTDVGGKVPGSMSIESTSIFEDGVQVPVVKLCRKGEPNEDLIDVLCRNSRQPDWYRSDLTALVAACRRAATRVCELNKRYGPAVYEAGCNELLRRNHDAVGKLIESQFSDEPSVFTDFVDDDGSGSGPYAVKCTMTRLNGKLVFDWDGTSAQSERSINYFLSETMFKMFVGYYLLAVFDPECVVNDGFHDLLEIKIPEGSVLRPVRPAAVSCRTHFLGRVMDIVQALMGQRNPSYRAAAGFSDSPHFFYSGWTTVGEWFQLYQIGFGGVPARPRGDGPDCHCPFPAIKSVPTESIELNFPLIIEANEALADTGGPGFFRGGNAQRTAYRFLSRGEFSLHDDRRFTKPWGIDGGQPGQRSRKILWKYSQDPVQPPKVILPSKCDHVRVESGDLLEWITWGGGGLGDPLTRPAATVALEVQRKLVTVAGAARNYGVIVDPHNYTVCTDETTELRATMTAANSSAVQRTPPGRASIYNRGGTLAELRASCLVETGLPPPIPQWSTPPYGPHVTHPYVKTWYAKMRDAQDWDLE